MSEHIIKTLDTVKEKNKLCDDLLQIAKTAQMVDNVDDDSKLAEID